MKRVSIGYLFSFKIEDNIYALGQILHKERNNITVAVFDITSKDKNKFNIENIGDKNVILVLTTMTTFFNIKRWSLLEKLDLIFDVEMKTKFKIETPEGFYAINHKAELLEPLSDESAKGLTYLKNVAPVVIVNTTKAFFGVIPMEDYYYDEIVNYIIYV